MSQSSSETAKVAIIKGVNPKDNILEGIEKLGGISKFINEGDSVFIKFNLRLPYGFPTNTNFDVLKAIITSCKTARASNIYIGSYPFRGVSIKTISDILGLKSYFEKLGAELRFLDNSDYYSRKDISLEQLKLAKERTISNIMVNDKEFQVPKIILESDKLISINQVNVDPLFKCTLSLLNSYSLVPNIYQEIHGNPEDVKGYIENDIYRQDLISNILDVFTIRKPDLVINDLFYVLEGAGPYIYRDSNLKETGITIIGNNAVAVDLLTQKILNIDILNNDIIAKAIEKSLGPKEISEINVIGENLNNVSIDLELCSSSLDDIHVRSLSLKPGELCSGCFNQAYHLLNLMKSDMIKDLKTLTKNSFLMGENPPDPDYYDFETGAVSGDIMLFGDCAINSSQNRGFRTVMIKKVKEPKVKKYKLKIKRLEASKIIKKEKTEKINNKISKMEEKLAIEKNKEIITVFKEKPNKNILELSGCPPNLFNCIKSLVKYYGKNKVPTLNLFWETFKSFIQPKAVHKLETWEALH